MKDMSNCRVCRSPLVGKQGKFCSTKCKNVYFQSYDAQIKRGYQKRAQLVEHFGGECEICGYRSSYSTLIFLQNYSDVHLNLREIANHDLEKLKKQLAGTTLVCKNCASEIENNDIRTTKHSKSLNFEKFQSKVEDFDKNEKIVLGVSGGVDSVVILDLFYRTGFKNIVVAHLNHNVRAEANKDQDFVEKLAQKYNYKFETKTLTPPSKGNLESQLRTKRRKFLFQTARDYHANTLVLAHNLNDQAETVFLNLLRGAGPDGLSGMAELETPSHSLENVRIFRPLLSSSKEEIYGYATKHGLEWREDITNLDIKYKRNLLRHRVLPNFEKINPAWLENVSRSTKIQHELSNTLKNAVSKELGNLNIEDSFFGRLRGKALQIKIDKLLEMKPILFDVAIREIYGNVAGTMDDLSTKHLKSIRSLVQNEGGTKEIHLPNKIIVKKTYRILEFYSEKVDNTLPAESINLYPGENVFGKWKITVEIANTQKISKNKDFLFVSSNLLPTLKVRNWQNGDYIEKEGLQGKKKLQDLYVDGKINRDERKNWPVVINDKNEIIWVPKFAYKRDLRLGNNDLMKITARKECFEK